jgi:hypothetical protein
MLADGGQQSRLYMAIGIHLDSLKRKFSRTNKLETDWIN